MSRASDKELGKLHLKITKMMLESLERSDTAEYLIEEHGDKLPKDVIKFLEKSANINPALMAVITKFLKDNDITCSIEDSDEMSELEKLLEEKRNRKKAVGNVTYMDEEDK